MAERGKLRDNTLVATVMSNLGLKLAMRDNGITDASRPRVGDRYVLEEMNEHDFSLGGEQSGHVIMSEFATTGDGILTGLHLAQRDGAQRQVAGRAGPGVMTVYPQIMVNVKNVDHHARAHRRALAAAVRRPRRPSSATPVACCCVRRAPSRSCASWWRRPISTPPTGSRTSSPTSCASAWVSEPDRIRRVS